jgi:hypothetical protein
MKIASILPKYLRCLGVFLKDKPVPKALENIKEAMAGHFESPKVQDEPISPPISEESVEVSA